MNKKQSLLSKKLAKVSALSSKEAYRIFGGLDEKHKAQTNCTSCEEETCDGQFENNNPGVIVPGL